MFVLQLTCFARFAAKCIPLQVLPAVDSSSSNIALRHGASSLLVPARIVRARDSVFIQRDAWVLFESEFGIARTDVVAIRCGTSGTGLNFICTCL